jgi:hypothetical protein
VEADADLVLAIHLIKSRLPFLVHTRQVYGHQNGKGKRATERAAKLARAERFRNAQEWTAASDSEDSVDEMVFRTDPSALYNTSTSNDSRDGHEEDNTVATTQAPNHTPPYVSSIHHIHSSSNAGYINNDWGGHSPAWLHQKEPLSLRSKERARWTTNLPKFGLINTHCIVV